MGFFVCLFVCLADIKASVFGMIVIPGADIGSCWMGVLFLHFYCSVMFRSVQDPIRDSQCRFWIACVGR